MAIFYGRMDVTRVQHLITNHLQSSTLTRQEKKNSQTWSKTNSIRWLHGFLNWCNSNSLEWSNRLLSFITYAYNNYIYNLLPSSNIENSDRGLVFKYPTADTYDYDLSNYLLPCSASIIIVYSMIDNPIHISLKQ